MQALDRVTREKKRKITGEEKVGLIYFFKNVVEGKEGGDWAETKRKKRGEGGGGTEKW